MDPFIKVVIGPADAGLPFDTARGCVPALKKVLSREKFLPRALRSA
jgi:hypothetical protein